MRPDKDLSDSVEAAQSAGLRYVADDIPGIRREAGRKNGDRPTFKYFYPNGGKVKEKEVLGRIKSLVIPPAWTDVWICPHPAGHVQATGRDARGRKQHRYHPRWRDARDEVKFARVVAFGHALPQIRKHVRRDLRLRGLPHRKVLAAVVRLLEVSLIRGNDEYARENDSFGLTTLRDRHVQIKGAKISFRFRGKSAIYHEIDVHDRRLAKIVRNCQDLPGQELFQYLDENGQRQDLTSEHVNDYLREISGADFTAKDFRTWAGTVLAAMALREFEQFDSEAQAKKNLVRAIESVARRLGNTPAVCRTCYVHPDIIHAYLGGSLVQTLRERADEQLRGSLHKLNPEEAAVLAFLRQRLASEETRNKSQDGRRRGRASEAPAKSRTKN